MTTRRTLIAAALAALVLPGVAALAADAPATPVQVIGTINDGLLQVMKAGKTTPIDKRLAILTPIIQRAFDLPLLLQNSVGPARWSGIPEAQKATLMGVFTQFTVASYVANFDSYNGETFITSPDPRKVGQDVVVQTRIQGTGSETTRLDYVTRQTNGGWHVVDILLDGSISRVAVTRSDYRSLLDQNDASRLIESLRGKVASLTAGAAP